MHCKKIFQFPKSLRMFQVEMQTKSGMLMDTPLAVFQRGLHNLPKEKALNECHMFYKVLRARIDGL